MRPEIFIARRYLFARKSHNVINIISIISVIGVMVGSMGLIIVLSVFNGFSGLVVSLYNSFDPDIKISAVKGKTFEPSGIDITAIQKIPGIAAVSFTLEETGLIKYRDRQYIATIKGVDAKFTSITQMSDKIIEGKLLLQDDNNDYAIVGGGVAYGLSLALDDPFNPMAIYIPRKGKPVSTLNPEEAFNIEMIRPSGIFSIQQDFDSKYVLVPIDFARKIIGLPTKVSSVEVALKSGADAESVRDQVAAITSDDFKVQTRLQQHEFLYKILKSEKWAVYFILSFILMIAIFNIIGSLTMLIIEKKKDIGILSAMGAENGMIRNIFLLEGLMITLSGAVAGLLIGGVICFLQQQFGIIKLENGESFVIDAYPVSMEALDFVSVLLIVSAIGFLAAYYTSSKIKIASPAGK